MKELTLYTIGYQGRDIEEFLGIMKSEGIETVVDIRGTPLSRKPGFSKNKLREHLSSVGVGYEHIKELGTPKELMNRVKKVGDIRAFKDEFKELFAGRKENLFQLLNLVEQNKICLLCFEKASGECHRTFIIEFLKEMASREISIIDL